MFHTWSAFWTPIHSADGLVEPVRMKKPIILIAKKYSNAFNNKIDVKELILPIWRRWNSTIQANSNNSMSHLHLKLNTHQHSLTWPDIDLIINSFNNSLCTFLICFCVSYLFNLIGFILGVDGLMIYVKNRLIGLINIKKRKNFFVVRNK